MKLIEYQKMVAPSDEQHKEPEFVTCRIECEAEYLTSNMAIAKEEAYLGEFSVEDLSGGSIVHDGKYV